MGENTYLSNVLFPISDLVGVLGEKLTDFSTIVDLLEDVKNQPFIFNKLLNNIKAILSNVSYKYELKADYLFIFPKLEYCEVEIIDTVSKFLILASHRTLGSLHFIVENYDTYQFDEYLSLFLNNYCTGSYLITSDKEKIEYTNNRNLKNLKISLHDLGKRFILVRSQIYLYNNFPNVLSIIEQFAEIKGTWNQNFMPKSNPTYHMLMYNIQPKVYDEIITSPIFNRNKLHFVKYDDKNHYEDMILIITHIFSKLINNGSMFYDIIQYDIPIPIDLLEEINFLINIFPNVLEFMIVPTQYFIDSLSSHLGDSTIYKDRKITFWQIAGGPNHFLPEIPIHRNLYDAMVAEDNLQHSLT